MPVSDPKRDSPRELTYEYPWVVRFSHWANAVTLLVLASSGLQIFKAFPSFGPKIPQQNLIDDIPNAIALGTWLGGALQWHLTFMWVFVGLGLLYVSSLLRSGRYRTVLFTPRDLTGVWPVARHYLLFRSRLQTSGHYNPLQKLAYTGVLFLGALSVATGLVMYQPVQLSAVGWIFGGYQSTRALHFVAMCGLLAFIPIHVVMVAVHGWDNLMSMVTGWKHRAHHGDLGPEDAPPGLTPAEPFR